MAANIGAFHLPLYKEIPTVGLYLEQTTKYINECLAPLGCIEVTASMVSNYVKKGYVSRPVKKQYDADQIGSLIFIVIAKQVLSMENIAKLFEIQRSAYSTQTAYDYFCRELERLIRLTFGLESDISDLDPGAPEEKKMLRSLTIAVAHMIYLSHCFELLSEPAPQEEEPEA